VTESPVSAPPEGSGQAGSAGTATLWPADMEWVIPSGPGGDGGGAVPPTDAAVWPGPAPAPRRPAPGPRALVAALVAAALAGFLVAGPLRPGTTPAARSASPLAGAAPQPSSATSDSGSSSPLASTVAAKVDKGVVDIDTELGIQGGRAAGTGMVLTPSGEVLTNNHVIDGATRIVATAVDTGRSYTATVVGTDPADDVAVLQLTGASGLKTVATAQSSAVAVGAPVVAVGNAGGRGGTPSATAGTVVAVGQTITATDENGANGELLSDLIEIDAPIQPGDSGGPLANAAGEVVGMNSAAEVSGARFRSTTGFGYAIPIDKALAVAKQIESGRASSSVHIGLPAFLGVQIAGNGGAAGAGALVAGVEAGTPAASIGLAPGDTITSVNGQAVDSPSGLTTLLHRARPGDQVAIGWTSQSGTQHSARATLATGPAD
jgi:S1-C subfamily serine protease